MKKNCLLFLLAASGVSMAYEWRFDYQLNAEVHGRTAYAPGISGKAFDFDGKTHIDCGHSPATSIPDNISVELWIYPRSWIREAQYVLLSKWNSTKDANYAMYFFGGRSGNNRKIGFYGNAGDKWQVLSPLFELSELNQWYHIVWTYNSKNGGKLYVNGSLVGAVSGKGRLAVNTAPVLLGKHGRGAAFDGLMDEVRIYDQVLTPFRILSHNMENISAKK